MCLACRFPRRCKAGNACSRGFAGAGCAFCDAGFFKLSTTCVACPVVPWPLLVFAALLAVAVFYASKKRLSVRQTTVLKIVFFYVQMVVVSLALRVDWPSTQTGFVEAVSLASGELGLPLVAECYVSVGWYASFGWRLAGPVAVVGSVWLATAAMHRRRRARRTAGGDADGDFALMARAAGWQRLLVAVAAGMHLPLIRVLLGAFACDKNEAGDLVVAGSDDGTSCTSTTHVAVQAASGVVLVVIGAVLPVLAMWFVLRLRERGEIDKAEVQAHWGGLYEGYERRFCFLEGVVAIRKVLVTLSLAVPVGAGTASVLLAAQSLAWTVFVAVVRPYERVRGRALFGLVRRKDLMNELEVVASSVVTAHQIVGGASVAGNGGIVWDEAGVVLLVVTVFVLAMLVWQLVRAGRGREVNPSNFSVARSRQDQSSLVVEWSSTLYRGDFEAAERLWTEGVRHARQSEEFAAWKSGKSGVRPVRAEDFPFLGMAIAADETDRVDLEARLEGARDVESLDQVIAAAASSGHFDLVRAAHERRVALTDGDAKGTSAMPGSPGSSRVVPPRMLPPIGAIHKG